MTAPAQNTGGPPAQGLTAQVRHCLSRRLVCRVVEGLGVQEIFFQSQSWEGYDLACERWQSAYWNWIDQQTPPELSKHLDGLQIDWSRLRGFGWSKLPCSDDLKKPWLLEQSRQEMLEQYAVYHLAMSGPEAAEAETYNLFLDDMRVARQIGVDVYIKELAKQKQRKPSKDKGDRRLKSQLLLFWIPGCLWAFTTDGIAAFLQDRYPRTGNKTYHPKTVSDAWRDLKLYRLPKPLWWGIAGQPPKLVPR